MWKFLLMTLTVVALSDSARARFDCQVPKRLLTRPTSVHQLRPEDVDVVGAIGDSFTAGNGASAWTILGCLTEYRGRSWSIGGDESFVSGVTTLPNILREFNPNMKGFSTGSGDADSSGAHLNRAVAGAISVDMAKQAKDLVQRMKDSKEINFEKDWKVVTMLIGGNDLCDFCNDKEKYLPENYRENIKTALDILHNELPRTFVNVVTVMDMVQITQLGNGIICGSVHSAVCSCASPGASDAELKELQEFNNKYQDETNQLVNSGRYDTRDDFTVVVQPFMQEFQPPKESNGEPDMSYFAPDCFHFSEKGQNSAGKELWNTMLEPVGNKQTSWQMYEPVKCPTKERPYLATSKNSE
ncbi:PLB1 [Branchiostoma lanceolatum]|uniref:Phospholipase B1, membrane-associated n=1 Tax=Branchiostoma lanceolatum TaxID=7740 RepID=A0A8J9ZVA2_BRALA|nr:PLB1 [Branchiostoma lanceolatum]